MTKTRRLTKCGWCGSQNYRAINHGVCDECIMGAAKQIEEMVRYLNLDVGLADLKIDLERYPIEEHADFYGIEYDEGKEAWIKKQAA